MNYTENVCLPTAVENKNIPVKSATVREKGETRNVTKRNNTKRGEEVTLITLAQIIDKTLFKNNTIYLVAAAAFFLLGKML